MRKKLLFIVAALTVQVSNAQLLTEYQNIAASVKEQMSKQGHLESARKVDFAQVASIKDMKPGVESHQASTPRHAPSQAGDIKPYYNRPAGMYMSSFYAKNGEGLWSYGSQVFLMAKPFADYTLTGMATGVDENCHYYWRYFKGGEIFNVDQIHMTDRMPSSSIADVPVFGVCDGEINAPAAKYYEYQMPYSWFDPYESHEGIVIHDEGPAKVLSIVNSEEYGGDGVEFMYSSKTMVQGGSNGDQIGMLSRYYGATPWGENKYGWWFGKNASHVDGIAQAFEKPQHPYLLKNVYLQAAYNDGDYIGMVVDAPVTMKCKVYRIDRIPDYVHDEHTTVKLPEVPGELIATGEATVTPTTGEANNGLITFTLYALDEHDSTLTYEYHPTIDYPILICIDGYNDPGMEDLVEFSAYVCTDDQVDEGYGELCYLKQGIFDIERDENGDTIKDENGAPKTFFTGNYYWEGLNNRFSAKDEEDPTRRAQMLTGVSIFIGTENPFITFNHGLEDGEYTFPVEGGSFNKTFEYSDQTITDDAIQFFSMTPSGDGDWWMTYNGSDELPDWLEINLSDNYDEESGEFSGLVLADVVAAPLPAGVKYREAVIRFEIPGDYIEYKFMQGTPSPFIKGDVNGDGEVNIADVNCLIDVILGVRTADEFEGRALVNDDDEVNIADVNAVIDIILGF